MNKRPRGLGSGLEALLPSAPPATGGREVATNSIQQNPRQPRTLFDEAALDELAASIREHGIIQPLIVSQRGAEQFELIAGERRWRAAQRAGLERVPVIVRETTPQQLLELALIENVQRADLNPIEEARAYQALKDDFALSDDQIAKRMGKGSRELIANTRRLLQLVPEAQEALLKNQISAGHGRALLKLKTGQEQQEALLAVVEHGLTVRDAERLSDLVKEHGDVDKAVGALRGRDAQEAGENKRAAASTQPVAARPKSLSPEDQDVKSAFERALATPVQIVRSGREIRVTITFHSDEGLQAFYDMVNAE